MSNKIYAGCDNGTTGAIALIGDDILEYYKTPVVRQLNYTKKKAYINRLDVNLFRSILEPHKDNIIVLLERPLVNPTRFKATISAVRCLEATIIVLEELDIPYQYIDSKQWQKELLPSGLNGAELKTASRDIAKRLFPTLKDHFKKDGDSILIAEFARRKNL